MHTDMTCSNYEAACLTTGHIPPHPPPPHLCVIQSSELSIDEQPAGLGREQPPVGLCACQCVVCAFIYYGGLYLLKKNRQCSSALLSGKLTPITARREKGRERRV